MLAIGSIRLQAINLGEYPPQAADENRLVFQPAGFHLKGKQAENLLRAVQREFGDEDAAAALEGVLDGADQFFDFSICLLYTSPSPRD